MICCSYCGGLSATHLDQEERPECDHCASLDTATAMIDMELDRFTVELKRLSEPKLFLN